MWALKHQTPRRVRPSARRAERGQNRQHVGHVGGAVAVAVGIVGVGDLGVDAPRQSGQKDQSEVFHDLFNLDEDII